MTNLVAFNVTTQINCQVSGCCIVEQICNSRSHQSDYTGCDSFSCCQCAYFHLNTASHNDLLGIWICFACPVICSYHDPNVSETQCSSSAYSNSCLVSRSGESIESWRQLCWHYTQLTSPFWSMVRFFDLVLRILNEQRFIQASPQWETDIVLFYHLIYLCLGHRCILGSDGHNMCGVQHDQESHEYMGQPSVWCRTARYHGVRLMDVQGIW